MGDINRKDNTSTRSYQHYYLHLNYIFSDNPKALYKTITKYPSPEQFYTYFKTHLQTHTPTKTNTYRYKKYHDFNAEKLLHAMTQKNIHCCYITDPEYPTLLKEIPYPPPVLFYKGDITYLNTPCIAIVGPRKATPYAREVTRYFAENLCHQLIIISGLAKGVDTLAHQTALKNKAPTIAILGCSVDRCYPVENQHLYNTITTQGLILSEFPIGTPPLPKHFPQRNRLISGLSQGVIVIEAEEKSGSLITARLAMETNRDVFAVPNSIFSTYGIGPHKLIQDGAKLSHTYQDILDELHIQLNTQAPPPLDETQAPKITSLTTDEQTLLTYLETGPKTLDDLQQHTHWPIENILHTLTMLDCYNVITELQHDTYAKKKS